MFVSAHTEISGTFVRICSHDLIDQALKRNSPERPAARYNRHGQDACLFVGVSKSLDSSFKEGNGI